VKKVIGVNKRGVM